MGKFLLDSCRRNINRFTTKALGFSVIGIMRYVQRGLIRNRCGYAGFGIRKQSLRKSATCELSIYRFMPHTQ